MASPAAVGRSGVLRFGLGVLAPLLFASGCLFSRIGYDHARTLAHWAIDDYLELDADQHEQLDQALRRIHAWHRRDELPVYAAIAREAAGRVERGLLASDLSWAEAAFRGRYEVLTGELARELAPVAETIAAAQLATLSPAYERSNRRFWNDVLRRSPVERAERRVDDGIELIEDWVGRLERGQRRQLGAMIAALPDDAIHQYAQRLVRQREMRALLEGKLPRDTLVAGLQRWLIGWEAGRTPEHEALNAEWMRQLKRLALAADRMLTQQQRAHLGEKLREHADDLTAWSARPVRGGSPREDAAAEALRQGRRDRRT